jgi:hypothetical protein
MSIATSLALGTVINTTAPTVVGTTTSTGTQNDFALAGATVLRCNNATDLTITGFANGSDGALLTVLSVGAGNVYLSHQAAGSSAGNRMINNVTSGPTPLAAGAGAAIYRYDGTTARWRLVAHDQGAFISIPYASLSFDSDTGAFWTVDLADLIVFRFLFTGAQALLHAIILNTTTLAGVGSRLRVTTSAFQPWTWSSTTRNWYRCNQAGTFTSGMVSCGSGLSRVEFSVDASDPAWGVGANNRTIDSATVLIGVT